MRQGFRTAWLRAMRGEPGARLSLISRVLLSAAAFPYWLGLTGYRFLCEHGILPQARLPCVVVSVGNLALGGTGKSTLVRWLAKRLQTTGLKTAVLLRGYRRRSTRVCVVSDGERLLEGVEQAGDEAIMLARTLPGVPVLVGKDRRVTGRLALERFNSQVLILDDGFQYWRLHKDVEIVLWDVSTPRQALRLFPRGALREPMSSLRRANWIGLGHGAGKENATPVAPLRPHLVPDHVFGFVHTPLRLRKLGSQEAVPLEAVRGKRVLVFSGTGNHRAVEETVAALGTQITFSVPFDDHHEYQPEDIKALVEMANDLEAAYLITTAKDEVKISGQLPGQPPLLVLEVELSAGRGPENMEKVVGTITTLVQGKGGQEQASTPATPAAQHTERWVDGVIKRVKGHLGFGFLIVLAGLARLLPRRWHGAVGRAVGDAAYYLLKRYRRVGLANLQSAFGAEMSSAEIRSLLRQSLRQLGIGAVETLLLPHLRPEQLRSMVSLQGLDNLRAGLEKGKGVILLTAHFGNWELMGARICQEGIPLSVIARAQDDPQTDRLVEWIRGRVGMRVIDRDTLRPALKCLADNEVLGILPDQHAGKAGVFVNFLGRPASTFTGAAALARRTGAAVVPGFDVRSPDGHHTVTFYLPLALHSAPMPTEEEALNTALFSQVIEEQIRRHPDHWLWIHQRWKTQPADVASARVISVDQGRPLPSHTAGNKG